MLLIYPEDFHRKYANQQQQQPQVQSASSGSQMSLLSKLQQSGSFNMGDSSQKEGMMKKKLDFSQFNQETEYEAADQKMELDPQITAFPGFSLDNASSPLFKDQFDFGKEPKNLQELFQQVPEQQQNRRRLTFGMPTLSEEQTEMPPEDFLKNPEFSSGSGDSGHLQKKLLLLSGQKKTGHVRPRVLF